MRVTRNMVRFFLVMGIIFLLPVLLWAQSGPYPTGEPYCILNAPAPALGENCFQFYLCAASNSNMCSAPPDPAWPGGWGPCILSPTAQRSGYAIDGNAHPPWEPRPFLNYEAAEYFASLLSPYGGDWYGCFGPPTIDQLPDRTPPVAVAPPEKGYCLLSKPDLYQPDNIDPPICFEFYKADTSVTPITQRLASIIDGECVMTDFGARQGWSVDPSYGGPYVGSNAWMESEVAMNIVSRYGDDFYGCLAPGDEGQEEEEGGPSGGPPQTSAYCPGHTICDSIGIGWNRAVDVNKDGICDLCNGKIREDHPWVLTEPDPSRWHCPEHDR